MGSAGIRSLCGPVRRPQRGFFAQRDAAEGTATGRRRSTVDQPPSERSAAADASKSTIAAIRPWRQRFPGSPRASER